MRKLFAVIVLILLWYFAGMYRQTMVMSAAICGALLIPVFAVIAFVQKRHLKLTLPKTQTIAFKNIEKAVNIYAENTGLMPVNYFKVWLYLSYPNTKKPQKRKFTGSALGRKNNSDNVSEFYLTAPYCGVIDIHLRKMRVYDHLALFSSGKRLDEHAKVLVFPVPTEMMIDLPPFGSYNSYPLTDTSADKRGDDHSEIRMIREYRPGDLNRYIHRNYSAKTDTLWVKEFRRENDFIFDIVLDTSSDTPVTVETADAMYEIFYSLVITLLHKDAILHVHWFNAASMCMMDFQIETEERAAEMLASIFNTDTSCSKAAFSQAMSGIPSESIIINSQLEWYFCGKPVYRFNAFSVKRELATMLFRLH